jgi:hypothetical protein
VSPGYNPDGYGDWRDLTIAEALQKLRGWMKSWLLRLGLIEFD